jgi:hypothetical protein
MREHSAARADAAVLSTWTRDGAGVPLAEANPTSLDFARIGFENRTYRDQTQASARTNPAARTALDRADTSIVFLGFSDDGRFVRFGVAVFVLVVIVVIVLVVIVLVGVSAASRSVGRPYS